MAVFPVEIIDLQNKHNDVLKNAVEGANQAQSSIEFSIIGESYFDNLSLYIEDETKSPDFFDELLRIKSTRGYHPYTICFINNYLRGKETGNLFSTRRSKEGVALATTYEVQELLKVSLVSYYLYEFAVLTLGFIVGPKKHHSETRGCIFDFKRKKKDILKSMRAGALCDQCRSELRGPKRNVPEGLLSGILKILKRCAEQANKEIRIQESEHKFDGYLPYRDIRAIYNAAIACDLIGKQGALLSPLPAEYLAGLDLKASFDASLFEALNKMNKLKSLEDGRIPLGIWLQSAITLSKIRTECSVFKKALRKLQREQGIIF